MDINDIKNEIFKDLETEEKNNEKSIENKENSQKIFINQTKEKIFGVNTLTEIDINMLKPFNENPFKLCSSEELEELAESIKDIVLFTDSNTDFYKQAKDENSQVFKELREKEEKYAIKIVVDKWEKDLYKSFLKDDYIRKPFIPKEVGNNEELYSLLLQKSNIPKNRLIEMFKENHIYQDVDRNMVFLVKDENGQDIGGYCLNVYDDKPEIKKLENTYISKVQEIEILNFATYVHKNINDTKTIEMDKSMDMEL